MNQTAPKDGLRFQLFLAKFDKINKDVYTYTCIMGNT